MPSPTKPQPPADLRKGGRGQRFWEAVTADHEGLRHDETELLAEACRLLDLVDELREAVGREGLLSTGSMGQTVAHPLLSELRSTRSELRHVLRQLGLPGESETS